MECTGPLLKTGRGHIFLPPKQPTTMKIYEIYWNIYYIIVSKSSGLMSFIAQIKVLGNTATSFMFAYLGVMPPEGKIWFATCVHLCKRLKKQQTLFLQLLFGLLRQIMFLSQCSGKTALKCPNEALSWGYLSLNHYLSAQGRPETPVGTSCSNFLIFSVMIPTSSWKLDPNTPPSPMRRCEDISIYEVSEKKTKDPFQMLEILGNQQHLKGENNLRPSTSPISSTFICLSCSHEFSKPKPKNGIFQIGFPTISRNSAIACSWQKRPAGDQNMFIGPIEGHCSNHIW